jgi:hypothetical protein
MVNYGYETQNWSKSRKNLLAKRLTEMITKEKFNGRPYVEIDALYEGVRIRHITELSDADIKKLTSKADKIYSEVKVINMVKKTKNTRKLMFYAGLTLPVDFIESLKNGEENAIKYDCKIKNKLKKAIDDIDFRDDNIYIDAEEEEEKVEEEEEGNWDLFCNNIKVHF